MRRVGFWLLWLFVFSIPWELFVVAFNLSSMSRLFGAATMAMAMLTVAASGRLRRPGTILSLTLAFTSMSLLSLLWSISPGMTAGRVFTYGQLLALVWLVRELARTREEQQSLMVAYCLGAYVSLIDLMRIFLSGQQLGDVRYTGSNLDQNDLGLTLAIGIPMAWHLFLNGTRSSRILGVIYVPFAVLGILLTASRGAFLAGIVALSIIPLTLPRRSLRSVVLTAGVLVAAVGVAAFLVPQYSWDRIFTIRQEVSGGTMSGRVGIWKAGLEAFQERQVLGAGAGAFEEAVEPFLAHRAPHNVFLAVLVEQGIVGGFVFGALLAACACGVYRLPLSERKVYGVIGLTWLVGAMTLGWQYRKTTWLIFGMISAQASVATLRRQISAPRRVRADADPSARAALAHRFYSHPLAQRASR